MINHFPKISIVFSFLIPFAAFSQQEIPEEYSMDYYEASVKSVEQEKGFDEKTARLFYESLYESKKELFLNNSVYFDDDRSKYLTEIKDKLILSDKDLKENIKIYVTKFSSKNAMCLPDGSIFFNIGLLYEAENEAQIAFIIAHEIGHYKKGHARNSVNRMMILEDEEENNVNLAGNYFRRMKYSRDNEFESDAYALSLMAVGGYDVQEAATALELLSDSIQFSFTKEDVMFMLSSETVTLEDDMFKKYKKGFSSSGEKLLIEDDNDLLQTHPNMDKRILALNEIIESMGVEYEGGVSYVVKNEEEFKSLVRTCEKDMIENLFKKSEYISSLALSLNGLSENESNQYMKISVIRNLYQLAYFKEIENINSVLDMNSLGKNQMIDELKGLVSNISFDDLKKLTYGYAKKELANLENDEELMFYHGLITRSYLGKEPANLIFNKYKAAHPTGKYITYINNL